MTSQWLLGVAKQSGHVTQCLQWLCPLNLDSWEAVWLTMTLNLKLIVCYHDRIEIDTKFEVMAVTPQTPKCHHNLGCASVVLTFGSLWCHSHDLKLGINSFIISQFQSVFIVNKWWNKDYCVFGIDFNFHVNITSPWYLLNITQCLICPMLTDDWIPAASQDSHVSTWGPSQ